MKPNANELTRLRALWRRCEREVAFELQRWALLLRRER